MRHRAQHDRTAKRWTELYALPPSPSDMTSVPVSNTKRAKGKERACTTQAVSSSRSGDSVASSSGSSNIRQEPQSEPISIDIVSEQVSASASAPPCQPGRKRRREPDAIDVDLGEDGRTRSRRRMPPAHSSSRLQSSRDVIVIDD